MSVRSLALLLCHQILRIWVFVNINVFHLWN